jgi:uncharacterized membrane protein
MTMGKLGYGAALAVGAALMYGLDPSQGARRRGRIRDEADHLVHTTSRSLRKASVDVAHRLRGAAMRLRSRTGRAGVDDRVLCERVRTRLGHYCSHPHAIGVCACEGVVELRGPILADEVGDVLSHARGVPGVKKVVDALERHATSGAVPALQGPRVRRRHGLFRSKWSPAVRWTMGSTGVWLAVAGARRGGPVGATLGALGAAAVLRAATNRTLGAVFGVGAARERGIDVTKTVTVEAPAGEVFDCFVAFENFPKFMRHVREVKHVDGDRWHWKVEGPGGSAFEWDGTVTESVRPGRVAWASTENAAVHNRGEAIFEELSERSTRLTIRLVYQPPLGAVGHAFARLLGADPKHELDDDLLRFKSLLERGKATGRDGIVTRDDLVPARS